MTASETKDSDSSDSRKTFIILIFDLYCRFFWIYFSFFSSSVVVVNFPALRNLIKHLSFFFFFLLSHIFYCCYKPLHLRWAFEVLRSFPCSLPFFNLNF